ncbi:hypothetical protein GCM10023063_32710 [Arthrobacter methylotrophus]
MGRGREGGGRPGKGRIELGRGKPHGYARDADWKCTRGRSNGAKNRGHNPAGYGTEARSNPVYGACCGGHDGSRHSSKHALGDDAVDDGRAGHTLVDCPGQSWQWVRNNRRGWSRGVVDNVCHRRACTAQ